MESPRVAINGHLSCAKLKGATAEMVASHSHAFSTAHSFSRTPSYSAPSATTAARSVSRLSSLLFAAATSSLAVETCAIWYQHSSRLKNCHLSFCVSWTILDHLGPELATWHPHPPASFLAVCRASAFSCFTVFAAVASSPVVATVLAASSNSDWFDFRLALASSNFSAWSLSTISTTSVADTEERC